MKRHQVGILCLHDRMGVSHRKTWRVIACMLLLGLTCTGLDHTVGCGKEPLYSSHGIQEGRIKSPDGKSTLVIRDLRDDKDPDGYVSYHVTTSGKQLSARLSGWHTEILWSPDSKAFAVNQTEGGGGIGQRTYVFYLEKSQLRRVDLSPHIERVFGAPVKCEAPVRPNTATIKWLDSKRILIAAEVVPVSICKCSGTFKTYEVSLPDLETLHVYGQTESKELFGEALGCELRHADDSCAKSWQK